MTSSCAFSLPLSYCLCVVQKPLLISKSGGGLRPRSTNMRNLTQTLAWTYRYSYMIDNVIFLLTGTRHQRDMHEVSTRNRLQASKNRNPRLPEWTK